MAERFAGSMESEIAGMAANPAGGMMQSMAKSLASVAEPPLPKIMSLPPRAMRSRIAAAALPIFSDSSCATCVAQQRVVLRFHADGSSDLRDDVERFLFVFAEEWVEKAGLANVMAQFAVFEEDVHGLPERVVENFDEFLMNEGIVRGGIAEIGAAGAWQRERHRVALLCRVQSGPDFGVAFGRTEAHDDVVRLHERFQPRFESERKIQRRQRAFSDNHRMDEFDGDVLGVCGVGAAAKSE